MSVNTENIDYMHSPHASILSQVSDEIPTQGDGTTQAQAQKIMFYVSDGVTDANQPLGCTKLLVGNRCQMPLDPTKCTEMKSRGIAVAVLHTTYLPLPTNGWYKDWIAPWQSQISGETQECASPGLFFEVTPSQGIEEAMVALFKKATASAHLTIEGGLIRGHSAYSITSSARATTAVGIAISSLFAVRRLSTSSKVDGRSIGRSLGRAPPRIFCT